MTVPIGNQTVTAVLVALGAPGSLGLPARTETQVSMSGCSFQPYDTTETLGDIDEVATHAKLFIPAAVAAAVDLNAIDSVITPWDGLRYDVDGDPLTWANFAGASSHQTIHLRRATG